MRNSKKGSTQDQIQIEIEIHIEFQPLEKKFNNILQKFRRNINTISDPNRNRDTPDLDRMDSISQAVPDLCGTIDRKDPLDKSLKMISRTERSGIKHSACVCVICDCFIIGTEPICWLAQEQIKEKESVLSVSYLELNVGKQLPIGLRNQYKISNNESLSALLLSPRAQHCNGSFMACQLCHRNVAYSKGDKPPKFAISNGFCIGGLPDNIIDGEISDILESSVSKFRIFVNIYCYNAGAHKAIKGHHVFFLMIQSM